MKLDPPGHNNYHWRVSISGMNVRGLCVSVCWEAIASAIAAWVHAVQCWFTSTETLTPSLPQPVKFAGWKVHAYTPANSIFEGPITSLLSILCNLTEILLRAFSGAKKQQQTNKTNNKTKNVIFQIWHFYWSFSEWRRRKHGREIVKDD